MDDSAPTQPPKRLGPPCLRVVEVDFLKPACRSDGARKSEEAALSGFDSFWLDWE
jgi:hypothetical protein